jgi:hypothetical protein
VTHLPAVARHSITVCYHTTICLRDGMTLRPIFIATNYTPDIIGVLSTPIDNLLFSYNNTYL